MRQDSQNSSLTAVTNNPIGVLAIRSPRRRGRGAIVGSRIPIARAALRLITSSYLVGVCTGRSAGFVPWRMRSTYDAERRNRSRVSDAYETRPPLATNKGKG